MDYGRPLGVLAALVVVVMTAGAVVNIGLRTLAGERVVAAGVVLALVAVGVVLLSAVGSKSSEWLSNPYW